MAQYTIRDINGYYIHFAGPLEERQKSADTLSSTVRIVGRIPTAKEFGQLALAMEGYPAVEGSVDTGKEEKRLKAALHGAVAEDTVSGEVIGCGLVAGDDVSFYYIKDIMVRPDWQGKRIGTAVMQELNCWLDENGANNALVTLVARETLKPFYQQFGFFEAFSMIRYIQREKERPAL